MTRRWFVWFYTCHFVLGLFTSGVGDGGEMLEVELGSVGIPGLVGVSSGSMLLKFLVFASLWD